MRTRRSANEITVRVPSPGWSGTGKQPTATVKPVIFTPRGVFIGDPVDAGLTVETNTIFVVTVPETVKPGWIVVTVTIDGIEYVSGIREYRTATRNNSNMRAIRKYLEQNVILIKQGK